MSSDIPHSTTLAPQPKSKPLAIGEKELRADGAVITRVAHDHKTPPSRRNRINIPRRQTVMGHGADVRFGKYRNQGANFNPGKKPKVLHFYLKAEVCGKVMTFIVRARNLEELAAIAEYKAENKTAAMRARDGIPFTFKVLSLS